MSFASTVDLQTPAILHISRLEFQNPRPSIATTMADFPIEIITQILSNLPVKSLLRFKSVCKSWYFLIETPNLIKLHLNQTLISSNIDNRFLLLYDTSIYCAEIDLHRNNHLSFSKLSLPFNFRDINFIGSCNGIICVANVSKTDIYFYNPFIRSYFNLPKIPIPRLSSSNVTLLGFGYDSINDDYKVLRIVQGYDENDDDGGVLRFEAKVFSYKKNSWKSVEGTSVPYFMYGYRGVHGCFVNGLLHYIVFEQRKDEYYSGRKMWIACFDLHFEKFSVVECPPWGDHRMERFTDSMLLSLTELGGCLSAMKVFYVQDQASNKLRDRAVHCAELWVMKEFGEKECWDRLFTNRFCEREKHWYVAPVVYSEDGRKVMVHVDGSRTSTRFEWYDLGSKNVERFTIDGVSYDTFDSGVFVGSLVSFGDKEHHESGKAETLPMKLKKKNDMDMFLSVGFKLRL